MNESIERMRKLVNDNLVMGLRFQMNRELNKLESEIEQELNSRAERVGWLADELYRYKLQCERYEVKIAELAAERDKLKELNGYHTVQYELASEDCDRLQAQGRRAECGTGERMCELGEPALKHELTDDELELLDAVPALKHLAMKAGLI